MDSEEESSIDSDSDELHNRHRRAKRPAAKKPAAKRKPKPPALPDKVKKRFLNDVEQLGSYEKIGQGKPFSVAGIVAQRPELYEKYFASLQNLIYYFRRRTPTQYREILDEYQVIPHAFRFESSTRQAFDSEPDPESLPDETSPSPRTTMQPSRAGGPPRVAAGANARAGGRVPTPPMHTGTLL
jgi:hypothetical protein